ncbi:hypothetical protein A2Z53_00830 [Candidatus Giovannonibacteria bacterium RIFCSPHIGHO2_02_42_15]|uniref:Zinc-binding domain-containing protein n=2 Tax=Candidatus Giovannoniibacteriota TaxID=1752738 RepID=A0A1F5VLM5_9BACT|nr:MAG: hypothetical protein UV11_C0020G0015 [Candidatus Giovannonibacteria bacterium GW2011_GWF2_42_19]OGF64327.1 MAG: hypothetical protein A2Z53_00830 [Candidatus Giovannonibacteria bacterium RIFCSPHIGHO2_02_42_15]
MENKNCQNCHRKFEITEKDLEFYKKINVPEPTFCPECRQIRRMVWRNERTLYQNTCGLCGKNIITLYSKDKPFKVYCYDCYHGDKWDPMSYGREIDFSRPFLEQFRELQLEVPRLYAFVFNNVNSEYTNGSAFNKNGYLLFVSDHNEDSAYSYSIFNCKDSFDCLNSNECELCYGSVTCKKCYRVFFSQDCINSQDLYFCKNLANCHDCVGSVNLRNKQYHIFNEPYSKEEYFRKLKKLDLGSFEKFGELKEKTKKFWPQFFVKYIHGQNNLRVEGDYIFNSKKSFESFDSEYLEDSKFIQHGNKAKDSQDGYVVVDNTELSYEIVSAIALRNVKFGNCVWHNYGSFYLDTCENSNNLFGCVGLKNKSYCILNKQYSKEEYEALLPKIIAHMNKMPFVDKKGREYRCGEFFPSDFSPFAYNETVAEEYFPLTKEKAIKDGYLWKDAEGRNYQFTIANLQIPDRINDVSDFILNEIIECAHNVESRTFDNALGCRTTKCNEQCTEAFRIILQELDFLRKMNLPLPRLCPNCRHAERFRQKNPLKLWKRNCMCNLANHDHGDNSCLAQFETTYSPSGSEKVFCEACYLKEII